MPDKTLTKTLLVSGMTCVNCERKIEKTLKKTPGVINVKASFANGSILITYDANAADIGAMEKIIEELDYRVVKDGPQYGILSRITYIIGIAAVLYGLYAILDRFDLLNIFYDFPEAKAGMGYGMLFVVGLLTSVHCIGMCGGINLSVSLSGYSPKSSPSMPRALAESLGRFAAVRSGLLYNFGRLASYTLIGGAVGMLGAAVNLTENLSGAIQLMAGVFMIIMGFNMLNVFPWLRRFSLHMPRFFSDRIHEGGKNGPLYVGLLNGFMPCGPLQAMQLYALSTGSFVKGALSMFMFSAGTLPLMFGLSALSSILSKKFTRGMMAVGGTMVIIMGVAMFGNGMNLAWSGTGVEIAANQAQDGTMQNRVQLVRTELHPRRYASITVQVGVPVRWTINAEPGTLNGCNNRFIIPEYNRLQKQLSLGENIVEFTPTRVGTFAYSCWMSMIHGNITVVEEDAGNTIVTTST